MSCPECGMMTTVPVGPVGTTAEGSGLSIRDCRPLAQSTVTTQGEVLETPKHSAGGHQHSECICEEPLSKSHWRVCLERQLPKRLILAVLGLALAMCLTIRFSEEVIDGVLRYPFDQVLIEYPEIEGEIAVINADDNASMRWRVALMTGFVLASPWIFCQMWLFIAAGVRPRERRFIIYGVLLIILSTALFIRGALFFLRFIAKPMMTFFIDFAYKYVVGVVPRLNLKLHIAMMTTMMVVFGLAFQIPVVVFVLGKLKRATVKSLNKYRPHVIVTVLVVAALATSPSPVDQIGLALPMWLLYELGVLLVYLFCKPSAAPEDKSSADESNVARNGSGRR